MWTETRQFFSKIRKKYKWDRFTEVFFFFFFISKQKGGQTLSKKGDSERLDEWRKEQLWWENRRRSAGLCCDYIDTSERSWESAGNCQDLLQNLILVSKTLYVTLLSPYLELLLVTIECLDSETLRQHLDFIEDFKRWEFPVLDGHFTITTRFWK